MPVGLSDGVVAYIFVPILLKEEFNVDLMWVNEGGVASVPSSKLIVSLVPVTLTVKEHCD